MGKKAESANVVFFKRMCELDGKIETIEMNIKELKEKAQDLLESGKRFESNLTIRRARDLESEKRELRSLKSTSEALYYKTGGWQ